MLEIGLHALAFVLTILVIAALKKGGKSLKGTAALALGIGLGYLYAHTGQPWSILSDKASQILTNVGDEFGAGGAALALAIGGWWHYTRPGPAGSVIQGLLMMTAASTATGLMKQATDIIASIVRVIAG
ncbi:hypothetical protein [Streptomyces sp. NPDC058045]|uniref:hypothetical protein n=1 Tax=Streptomyces sp. NPDC058045 TaxID=3346311 RepID=UPI0036F03D09